VSLQILSTAQIEARMQRLALQIRERNFGAPHLNLVGISPRGTVLAERLKELLEVAGTVVQLAQFGTDGLTADELGKLKLSTEVPILVIDDVLNTGKTLFAAVQATGALACSGIQVCVLVDRGHRHWPISADFVGLHLATTLQEYIRVEMAPADRMAAYLD
jgi:pyrimidine operon attenuation protein / uracil phosphoribosyltransferase